MQYTCMYLHHLAPISKGQICEKTTHFCPQPRRPRPPSTLTDGPKGGPSAARGVHSAVLKTGAAVVAAGDVRCGRCLKRGG